MMQLSSSRTTKAHPFLARRGVGPSSRGAVGVDAAHEIATRRGDVPRESAVYGLGRNNVVEGGAHRSLEG